MGKHQDPDWLYEQYVEKERPPSKIAEECGVHPDTIIYQRDKHGFPKVDHSDYAGDYGGKYRDKEWLNTKYWEQGYDTQEIAEMCDVVKETIRRWLHKHDLGTRDRSEWTKHQWEKDPERAEKQAEVMSEKRRSIHASFFTRRRGYSYAGCGVSDDQVAMHRLLAVAEYGLDEVIGKDVHHKNGVPWDNRPENIELLTRSEHQTLHMAERA